MKVTETKNSTIENAGTVGPSTIPTNVQHMERYATVVGRPITFEVCAGQLVRTGSTTDSTVHVVEYGERGEYTRCKRTYIFRK